MRVQELTKQYDGKTVVDGVSFAIPKGKVISLIGPNGAGKSTVMGMISRLIAHDSGLVDFEGKDIGKWKSKELSKRLAILTQSNNIQMKLTVRELVTFGRFPYSGNRVTPEDQQIIDRAIHYMELEEFQDRFIDELSGGQRQRALIAMVIAQDTEYVLLDEPTNHLDIYTRENLTEALMAYTGTLLMVTHDRHLMNSLGCPILYLEDGKATLYPSYDALMGRAAPAAAPEKAGDQPAKAGYGKEQRRRRAELRAKIKACEDEMEACGAREVELDNEINSPEVYNDPDLLRQKSDELSDLRFHQEELFAAWEKAMEEQEQYEQAADEE